MTMRREEKRRGEGGGRFDRRRGRDHISCDNFLWARHHFGSFLNDRKKTMMTNEMAIRTRC
jgi:hypothetical protein